MSNSESTTNRRKINRIKKTVKQKNTITMKGNKKSKDSNQIAKSKELQLSPRKKQRSCFIKQFARNHNNGNKLQSTNNAKLLPSLVDLEKMFEDNNTNQSTTICDNNTPTEIQQAVIEDSNEILEEISFIKIDSQNLNQTPSTVKSHECNVNGICDIVVIDADLNYSPRKKQKIDSSEIISDSIENNAFYNGLPSNVIDVSNETTDDLTIGYDIVIPNTGRFSPLPSTSKDSDTILENDLRFNASLTSNNISQPNVNISSPIETISIDDDGPILNTYDLTQERNQYIPPPIILDDEYSSYELHNLHEEAPINISDLSITENTNTSKKCNSPRFPAPILDIPMQSNEIKRNRVLRPSDHGNNNINEIIVGDDYEYDPNRKVKLSEFFKMFPCRNGSQNQNRDECIYVTGRSTQTDNNLSSRKRKHDNDMIPINGNSEKRSPIRNIGDCPICFESLSSKSICSTLCGHIFCTQCLKKSLKVSRKCPTCRKQLKNNGYHLLFL